MIDTIGKYLGKTKIEDDLVGEELDDPSKYKIIWTEKRVN
jgi:hypothetical protein